MKLIEYIGAKPKKVVLTPSGEKIVFESTDKIEKIAAVDNELAKSLLRYAEFREYTAPLERRQSDLMETIELKEAIQKSRDRIDRKAGVKNR